MDVYTDTGKMKMHTTITVDEDVIKIAKSRYPNFSERVESLLRADLDAPEEKDEKDMFEQKKKLELETARLKAALAENEKKKAKNAKAIRKYEADFI